MASTRLLVFRFPKFQSVWRQCGNGYFVARNGFLRELSTSTSLLEKQGGTDNAPAEKTATPQELRFGKVFDKKPMRVELEEGKLYSWCTCGHSKKQPFCDNSHRAFNETDPDKSSLPPFRSHKFQVDTKKEYSLCCCKQTKNRPFCDGTHKQKFVQDAVLS